jgi:hypothetical protein
MWRTGQFVLSHSSPATVICDSSVSSPELAEHGDEVDSDVGKLSHQWRVKMSRTV